MQYLFTERAHLMCPHMCFGLVMTVSRPYDAALIRQCVDRLAAAHPFLNALLGYEEAGNVYFYRVTDQCQAELLLKEQAIPSTDAPEIMEAYQQLTGRDWNLLEEGLLKIAAWSMGSDTPSCWSSTICSPTEEAHWGLPKNWRTAMRLAGNPHTHRSS